MNQSELVEKVAQTAELDHAAADQAVKAVVNTILDALSAVSRFVSPASGFSMWRRVPRARGGIHEPARPSRLPPARPCGSTPAKPSKMP